MFLCEPVELIVPLCGPWRDFQEVTFIAREGRVVAVGKTREGYDERAVAPEEVSDILKPYLELYDWLGSEVGRALGVEYARGGGDLFSWLRSHVEFVDVAGARWGRAIDGVGPFSVRRFLRRVYMPYSGHSLTLSYVAFPFPDAVVHAENKARVMAVGSVVVEWGGVRVASAGIRTLAGAFLLAQAAPELLPLLGELKRALEEFVGRFYGVSGCEKS